MCVSNPDRLPVGINRLDYLQWTNGSLLFSTFIGADKNTRVLARQRPVAISTNQSSFEGTS
jgi:hypothetical protein